MPKKTTIFIVILALVTVGLIYLAVRTTGQQDSGPQTEEEVPTPSPQIQKTAILYFDEEAVTASPGAQITADILLDSGGQIASTAQVHLKYDPTQITLNSIEAPTDNFFGADQSEYIVLDNSIDPEAGIATFSISIPPPANPNTPVTSKPLTGIDSIATISIVPVPGFQGTTTVDIITSPDTSMVLTPDPNFLTESILLEAIPLQVTVQ